VFFSKRVNRLPRLAACLRAHCQNRYFETTAVDLLLARACLKNRNTQAEFSRATVGSQGGVGASLCIFGKAA
jgi:hypothetical protein